MMDNFLEIFKSNPNNYRMPHPYTKYGVSLGYSGDEIRILNLDTAACVSPYLREGSDRLFVNLYSDIRSPKTGKFQRHTMQLGAAVLLATQGPPPFPNAQCSHLDDDATNCRPDNLAWEKQEVNILRQLRANKNNKGGSNPNAKLTDKQREEIISLLNDGYKGSYIAWLYQVHQSQITRIKQQAGITVKGWRTDAASR